jgi:hypothetical protein
LRENVKKTLESYNKAAEFDTEFIKLLLGEIFSPEELKTCTPTGRQGKIQGQKSPKLDEVKMSFLIGKLIPLL